MSYGKMAVDWEEGINFEQMRKDRLEKAQAAMKAHGLDAILIFRGDNERYVAQNIGNFRNMTASGSRYVFLPREGRPVLFEQGMWYPYVKENVPWVDVKYAVGIGGSGGAQAGGFFPPEVYTKQLGRFAEQIKNEMKEHGLSGEKLGMDANLVPQVKALNAVGIKESLEGGAALTEARNTKTKEEVECLRMAASIVEAAWMKCKEMLKPGVTELELRSAYYAEVFRQGGLPYGTAEIVSGPRTWCNSIHPGDRSIRPGDSVIMLGCETTYMGYWTCYYRTFTCGRPSEGLKDAFSTTRDYLYDALKLVKPGATTKQLAEQWPKASEFGYKDEDEAFWIQWGHGIGMSLAEPPTVTRLWSLEYPLEIRAGQTMALETWWPVGGKSHPGVQSVRLEEMLYVTETGAELLSQWPIDELTVCDF